MDLKNYKPDLSKKYPRLKRKENGYEYKDVVIWYLRQEWGVDFKTLPPALRLRSDKLIGWNKEKGLSPISTVTELMENYWKREMERWNGV